MRWLAALLVAFAAAGQTLDEIERVVDCRDGFDRFAESPAMIDAYLDLADEPDADRAEALRRKWAYIDAMPRDEQCLLNEWDKVVDSWFRYLTTDDPDERIDEATLRDWLGQMQNYGKPGSHAAAARGMLRYARMKLDAGETKWAGYYGEQVFRSSAAPPDRWEAFRLWTMDTEAIEQAAHYAGLILDGVQDPLFAAELPSLFAEATGEKSKLIRERLVAMGKL